MAQTRLSKEQAQQAVEALRAHKGVITDAARSLGMPRGTFKNRIDVAQSAYGMQIPDRTNSVTQPDEGVTVEGNAMAGTIPVNGRVTTEDEAIAKSGIDTEVWEITQIRFSFYETTTKDNDGIAHVIPMTSVKFRATRRSPISMERIHRRYIDEMKKHSPRPRKIKRVRVKDGQLLVVSIPDLHVGKLAWALETGEAYNIKIAERVFREAVDDLVSRAAALGPYERVLFVVGNDLLHVDGGKNATTRGTPQDTDGRWQQAFIRARALMVEAIETLKPIAPVDVVVVPGNHAKEKEFCLGDSLECWFHNDPDVKVDNSPAPRKYYQFGTVVLGLAHGDEEKHDDLEAIMAREMKDAFANATCMEFLLGHLHIKRGSKSRIYDTFGGLLTRILKSLSGTDAWHKTKGYASSKGAQALVYSKTDYVAELNHTPDQKHYREAA